MKNILLFILLYLIFNLTLTAQSLPHQINGPPANPGYRFTRSLYVDCSEDIVFDINNGNPAGLKNDLIHFLSDNKIGYVVLCGLENSGIFGNTNLENALRVLISSIRSGIVDIQIGVMGSDESPLIPTPNVILSPLLGTNCFPSGTLSNRIEFINLLNYSGNIPSEIKKAELCKFFYQAAQFGINNGVSRDFKNCNTAFDALCLQFPYWQQTSSLSGIQSAFNDFKKILSVMKLLSCSYNCPKSVDAEFLPIEIFMLQGWTAIDQIDEADTLIDRIILPVLTNNVTGIYSQSCKLMHFFTDQFSKSRSRILFKLSAESTAFNYCNSSATPGDYLGNYLNGTVLPSGNMYSVEKEFISKYNNTNGICTACNCSTYVENHFTPVNVWANIISGSVWTPYTMMKQYNLTRIEKENESSTKEVNSAVVLLRLIELNGNIRKEFRNPDENLIKQIKETEKGIYFIWTEKSNGEINSELNLR